MGKYPRCSRGGHEMRRYTTKGATVEVIKGRKVAVGTIGKVFWIAEDYNKWGVLSVGIITENNEKHFIDETNLVEIRQVEGAEGFGVEMWGSSKYNCHSVYEFTETLYDAFVLGGKFSDKSKSSNFYKVFKVVK
jgi:hypothetical protein